MEVIDLLIRGVTWLCILAVGAMVAVIVSAIVIGLLADDDDPGSGDTSSCCKKWDYRCCRVCGMPSRGQQMCDDCYREIGWGE